MNRLLKKIIITTLLLPVLACSGSKDEKKRSAELSYIEAKKLLDEKGYLEAAEAFEKIDSEFPFSKWSTKGQTMAVYARYKDKDYDKLIEVSDDFIRLNPSSEYVPYMMYMKGLSYYNQIPNIQRAQDVTKKASFTFRELIARFSTSEHAKDARKKLPFIDEHLAGAKMSSGRYLIKVENYVGAISYFSNVTSRHRFTNQVPEAYFRLAEIYYKIGLKQEALQASNALQKKFPTNSWTKQVAKLDSKFR